MKVKSESEVTQSCPTLHDPMDCSLPGSSVHGIFQARVLEWGAIAFSAEASENLVNLGETTDLITHSTANMTSISMLTLVPTAPKSYESNVKAPDRIPYEVTIHVYEASLPRRHPAVETTATVHWIDPGAPPTRPL